jgi:hypothetical protein
MRKFFHGSVNFEKLRLFNHGWLFYCKTIHGQAMRGTTAQIVTENISVFQKQFASEIEYMQEQQRKLREDMQKQQMEFKEEMRNLIDENLSRQRTMTSRELTQFSEALNKIARAQ